MELLNQLGFGLGVTLICMTIVFLVLTGLIYVIKIQRVILEGFNKKATIDTKIVEQKKNEIVKNDLEDEDLIAVITAAIAAFTGKAQSNIIVKSIKNIDPDAPVWAKTGRQEVINSRF